MIIFYQHLCEHEKGTTLYLMYSPLKISKVLCSNFRNHCKLFVWDNGNSAWKFSSTKRLHSQCFIFTNILFQGCANTLFYVRHVNFITAYQLKMSAMPFMLSPLKCDSAHHLMEEGRAKLNVFEDSMARKHCSRGHISRGYLF